ncbi:hypothetical protein K490DRAFT_66715 [Saccharata proteae CBS 121410]|uniref:Mitotic checkpoint regulator, MAD2B-interacting-domain-containing protein n=1 Tax=Saccharata proteae CBS 121410 TaxID=1314787 RepID=A0A9P4LVZ6_9PEZI|nr:hypothetical protein K490DRAFT_66715 [Saccharata proteae CBS 121410]
MDLVGYSDSEDSDTETPLVPKPAPKPASSSAKPAFEKVVDRSNPRKIRVNLPSIDSNGPTQDEIAGDAPPAKKARVGGGAFSGFNSFLPAPKKTGPAAGGRKGLGSGVNLKTGAAPAFSREPMPEPEISEDGPNVLPEESVPVPETEPTKPLEERTQENKPKSNPLMFKPLSVQNNARKKRKVATAAASNTAETTQTSASSQQSQSAPAAKPKKPKVSLFSIEQEESTPLPNTSSGEYQPMLYKTEQVNSSTDGPTDDVHSVSHTLAAPVTDASSSHSLDAVVADLKLTESERRQLFGRQRGKNGLPDLSAINVVNFNTDHEYQANEELRAAGETIQHNPVKGIAPGKHSLKQLVSAATTNKDALEESFAAGRRNKKEAGSRYGW